jgi:hypothetical protein
MEALGPESGVLAKPVRRLGDCGCCAIQKLDWTLNYALFGALLGVAAQV